MAKEVTKAKDVLEKTQKELKQMIQLNKVSLSVIFGKDLNALCQIGLEAVTGSPS